MSYNNKEKLEDYRDRKVELAEDSWEHIQESHPEITLEVFRSVLSDPLEVRECVRQNFVERFYLVKTHPEGKLRFSVVVFKVIDDGLFISTAMTTNSMKSGRTLYRKGEER